MKHKKLLIALVVVVLVLVAAAIGNYWDSTKPPAAPSAAPPVVEPTAPADEPSPVLDADAQAEVLAAVESLVPDEYRGASYSCDILTSADGTGFIVSLQVDVDVAPPESSQVIASLEDAINGLGDARISGVEIIAVKDMQIVDNNMGA